MKKEKIELIGLLGVYLYAVSLVTSKGGVNIGLVLMTISALFFIKNLKVKEIEQEYKFLLLLLLLIPIFDMLSPGGLKSAGISIKQSYRFLPVFIAPIFLTTKDKVEKFMFLISTSVLVNCLYGLNVYRIKKWDFSARYQSFTNIMDSPHALTGLSFIILILILNSVKEEKNKRLYYLIPTYILNLFCILLSQTRGAWLALIAGLIIFVVIGLSRKSLLMLFISSFLIVGVTFKTFENNRYIKRFYSIKDISDPSPKIRFLMWEASLKIYSENKIFGTGKNNSSKYYLEYFDKNNSYSEIPSWARKMMKDIAGSGASHNMYFENLVNMGMLSFFLFGFWLYILYKAIALTLKQNKDNYNYWICLGVVSMITAYYITGLTEAAWGNFIKRHVYLVAIIIYISNKRIIEYKE